ncbi:3203_t:CDS:1, partial [Ambispora leptoticha]
FLQKAVMPSYYTKKQIGDLKHKTWHYIMINQLLYKTNPHNTLRPLRVLKTNEV